MQNLECSLSHLFPASIHFFLNEQMNITLTFDYIIVRTKSHFKLFWKKVESKWWIIKAIIKVTPVSEPQSLPPGVHLCCLVSSTSAYEPGLLLRLWGQAVLLTWLKYLECLRCNRKGRSLLLLMWNMWAENSESKLPSGEEGAADKVSAPTLHFNTCVALGSFCEPVFPFINWDTCLIFLHQSH